MAQLTTEAYLEQIQSGLMEVLTKKKEALPPGFNEQRFALNCITVVSDMLKDSKKRDQLNTVDINSIVLCLIKGAYLGLDFLNGECYAIPYKGVMSFQTDYKGEIKVCKQFSKDPIKDIYAKVVREGDEYVEGVENGIQKVNFKPIPFSDKDIIGAFAVVIYKDGTMKYDSMSKTEIEHTKSVYSKAKDSQAWKESSGEMYKKTVIRRLSKLIDKNLDRIENIEAYEDGSGFGFENQASGKRIAKTAEDDKAIDVFSGTAGAIEEKPKTQALPERNGYFPAKEPCEMPMNQIPDIPDDPELPFK